MPGKLDQLLKDTGKSPSPVETSQTPQDRIGDSLSDTTIDLRAKTARPTKASCLDMVRCIFFELPASSSRIPLGVLQSTLARIKRKSYGQPWSAVVIDELLRDSATASRWHAIYRDPG